MDKNILGMFGQMDNDMDRIMSRSSRAVCGPFEREIIVKDSKVSSMKSKLKKKGFFIVGTGPGGIGRTKIWFNPTVSL